MEVDNIQLSSPTIQFHVLARGLPQQFEHALNQAVQDGWKPIPETFRVGSSQSGQMEYAILLYRQE